jgi:hypothetical protein
MALLRRRSFRPRRPLRPSHPIARSRGRGVARRRIASCWRSTRFSATRLARGRSAERSVPITACRMASIAARFAPAALPVTRESLWPTRYAGRWPRTRCVRRNPEKMHSSSPQAKDKSSGPALRGDEAIPTVPRRPRRYTEVVRKVVCRIVRGGMVRRSPSCGPKTGGCTAAVSGSGAILGNLVTRVSASRGWS